MFLPLLRMHSSALQAHSSLVDAGGSGGGGACVAAAAAAAAAHLRKACRASILAGNVWPLSSHLTLPSAVTLKRPGGWASSSCCTSAGSDMLHALWRCSAVCRTAGSAHRQQKGVCILARHEELYSAPAAPES